MEVWKILSHSCLRLLRDFEKIIKITGVLISLIILSGLYPVFFSKGLFTSNIILSIIIDITLFIISVIFPTWVLVATTRFMLRDEIPSSFIPKFYGKIIFLYFWKTFLLFLCPFIPLFVCLMFLDYILKLDLFFSSQSAFAYFIFYSQFPDQIPLYEFQLASKSKFILFIFSVSLFYFYYRLCLILSATAINVKFRISEAWQATKGYDVLIILLSIFSVILSGIGIYYSLVSLNPILYLSYIIFVNYFGFWWYASVMATLYQHSVEKRPLVEV